ncbi:MAG: uroporphyrinogen decarboxylase family protein [Verrucomicrobiales bacterium]|nr:uroporphyrinogen decarboxylase family protein [Verrucomicrobiales bacterium]
MNSRQLVRHALAGLPAPRVPTGPLAVHFCASLAGVSLRDYTLDAAVLADCVVRYYEAFRPDAIWLSADTWVTAEALGASVAFPDENQPLAGAGHPLIESPEQLDSLPPPDPHRLGRQPLMIDALRRIRRAVGEGVFLVACFDQYPFSLACALLGMNEAMTASLTRPGLVEAVMSRAAAHVVAYADALADAGADMLSGGDAPAGLLGPALYRRLALPFEQEVIAGIRARGKLPVSLHICGNATPILPDMAASGADVLELDHRTDLTRAARLVGPDIALWGNLDPVGLLTGGTPTTVATHARQLVESMQSAGQRRFILSSGCTIAPGTPPANLKAMLDASAPSPPPARV